MILPINPPNGQQILAGRRMEASSDHRQNLTVWLGQSTVELSSGLSIV